MTTSKENAVSPSTEPKAKEILSQIEHRTTTVERMLSRMRPLRPPVSTSSRLFEYFDIPDPYHPLEFDQEKKWELGSTQLVLGENKRPVAPHAKVPELTPKVETAPKPPQFRPQGIPDAPSRTSDYASAEPKKRVTSGEFDHPAKNKQSSGEFGNTNQGHRLVGKLPVRPDLQTPATTPTASGGTPSSNTPKVSSPLPTPTKTSAQGKVPRMRRSVLSNAGPVIKDLQEESAPQVEHSPVEALPAINRSLHTGDGGLDDLFGFGGQTNEGRMQMPKRSKVSNTPVTQSVNPASPATPATPATPVTPTTPSTTPAEPASINRSPSAASSATNLDDLFGFGGQGEERVRLPKRTPKST